MTVLFVLRLERLHALRKLTSTDHPFERPAETLEQRIAAFSTKLRAVQLESAFLTVEPNADIERVHRAL